MAVLPFRRWRSRPGSEGGSSVLRTASNISESTRPDTLNLCPFREWRMKGRIIQVDLPALGRARACGVCG